MTRGPGGPHTERRARLAGGHPPLAWGDDIDDPAAQPRLLTPVQRADVNHTHVEDIEWLLDSGAGHWDNLTTRLGIRPDSIYTACKRAGRDDLMRRLRQLSGYIEAVRRAS